MSSRLAALTARRRALQAQCALQRDDLHTLYAGIESRTNRVDQVITTVRSLSPVLASLNLFYPDYFTGQEVATGLYLINDSWHDAAVHIDLLLTRESPEWIPEAECFNRSIHHPATGAVLQNHVRSVTEKSKGRKRTVPSSKAETKPWVPPPSM